MKLKLGLFHKIGLVLLALGLCILIFGISIFIKCSSAKDLSELSLSDIKEGMYVKGKIIDVVKGYRIGTPEGVYSTESLDVYTTQSEETTDQAATTYFILELGEGRGEYVCIVLDEFLDTDLYWQVITSDMTEATRPTEEYTFEGVFTHSDREEKMIMDYADSWQDTYSMLYFNQKSSTGLSKDTISPCCIKLKNLKARKMWWLYSIPFLFAGITLMVLGGKPVKRIK